MLKKSLCPCCSQPLLRHVSFKRTFWFCSHCYQEMPDLSNCRETAFHTQHWLSTTIERQPTTGGLRQHVKPSSGLKPKIGVGL